MPKTKATVQVEFLRGVLEHSGRIIQANFAVQRGLLQGTDRYFYLTLEQQGTRTLHEFQWTPELEQFLLGQGCPMQTPEEEAERFATILLNNLSAAEDEFGRDYAHAVFVEFLRSRPEYRLDDLIVRVPAPTPSHNGTHYVECRRFIESSIIGVQNTAIVELNYRDSDAVSITNSALRIVLDEVFHISVRDLLFPEQ